MKRLLLVILVGMGIILALKARGPSPSVQSVQNVVPASKKALQKEEPSSESAEQVMHRLRSELDQVDVSIKEQSEKLEQVKSQIQKQSEQLEEIKSLEKQLDNQEISNEEYLKRREALNKDLLNG